MVDGFPFYASYWDAVKKMPAAEQGVFVIAMCKYWFENETPEFEYPLSLAWDLVKPNIDAYRARQEVGKRGGRPAKTMVSEKENHSFEIVKPRFEKTKTEKEKEKEKDKEIEKERDKEKNAINCVIDLYNSICISLPKCTKLTEKRKKAILARLKTYSTDEIKKAFELAQASEFLKGAKGFKASFDWLMNESNLQKVLEGNYSDKRTKSAFANFDERDTDYDALAAALFR